LNSTKNSKLNEVVGRLLRSKLSNVTEDGRELNDSLRHNVHSYNIKDQQRRRN